MALRGFSSFEKMFRAKMAQTTPINVLTAKKKNDGLTQQELADYRRVFNKFDKDSGGSIDADELGTLIRVLGLNPTNEEIEEVKNDIDEDGNGEIEFNEFLTIMNSTKLRCLVQRKVDRLKMLFRKMQAVDNRESRLRRAFAKIEISEGRLRGEDLKRLLTTKGSMRLSVSEVDELISRVDPDSDGLYSKDDFINLLTC